MFIALVSLAEGQTWTSQDIGAVGATGSYSYNSTTGVYTVSGNGSDIWNQADAFHFVYQTISGDGELTARVAGVQNTSGWAKAGVMIRQDTTAGSIHGSTVETPGNGVSFQYRLTDGGSSGYSSIYNNGAPWWVKIIKDGNLVTSLESSDGVNWTPMGAVELSFTGPVDIGLVVCSNTGDTTLCTATFDHVSLVSQNTFPPPAPWLDQDIGSTGYVGQVHYEGTAWTMGASGDDIWNEADAFHFAYQPLVGDGSIVAQVSAQTYTDVWTKCGVMIRQDLTPGAANALVAVTPGNGITFQYRSTAGGNSSYTAGAGVTAPYWVKLSRVGNQFYAYQSADGVTWQQVGVQTITMSGTVYIGLAETSHNNSAIAVGLFNNVQVTPPNLTINNHTDTTVNLVWQSLADPSLIADYQIYRNGVAITTVSGNTYEDIQLTPSTTYTYQIKALGSSGNVLAVSSILTVTTDAPWLPNPWTHLDIGQLYLGGSSQLDATTGTYTQTGSGDDIWNNADAFQFADQPLSGDGQIVARVESVTYANSWTKAGIMLRETNDPGSKNVLLALTPGNGITFQERTSTGGSSNYTNMAGGGPVWLKLVRQGTTVTGFTSTDGVHWMVMTSTPITMNTSLEAGLALTSHDDTQLATSVIDQVTIGAIPAETQPPSIPGTPTAVAVGDVSATLQWTPSTDTGGGVTSYQILRNGQVIGQTGAHTIFTDTGLAPGQSYAYTVTATNVGGLTSSPSGSLNVTTQANTLPSHWTHRELGTVALAGSASSSGNVFTISASGDDIWNSADAFGYVYQTLTGDGTITARVSSLTNTNPWSKAGVMLRQSLDPGSAHAFMLVSAANGLAFQSRDTEGDSSGNQPGANSVAPVWVQLVRAGSVITGYSSTDGVNWTYVMQQTFALNATLYAGLAVTSHDNGVRATATFDNVSVLGSNGLPNWWEMQYFGDIGNNPNSSPDGNGFTLLQDYQGGADPTNYYSQPGSNGPILITPTLSIVSGNDQTTSPSSFTDQPLVVSVTNSSGGASLQGAPVTFSVTSGGGLLAPTRNGTGLPSASMALTTDGNGLAQAFYQSSATTNAASTVSATTAAQAAAFTETTSSGDGTFDAPGNVVATSSSVTEIDLTWVNHATTATGILIEQSIDNVTWTTTATLTDPTATTYAATGLTGGQVYYFRVSGTK